MIEEKLMQDFKDAMKSGNTIKKNTVQQLRASILLAKKDNPKITVIYFVKDKKKNGGSYLSYIGQVKRIDSDNRQVVFLDKKKINIEDITSIILN